MTEGIIAHDTCYALDMVKTICNVLKLTFEWIGCGGESSE